MSVHKTSRTRRARKLWLLAAMAVVALPPAGHRLSQWHEQRLERAALESVESLPWVEAVEISLKPYEEVLPFTGEVRGIRQVDLRFAREGRVRSVAAAEGAVLKAGDEIARLDDADVEPKMRAAQIELADHERFYELGAIRKSRLEEIRAECDLARAEFEKTLVRAPGDGVLASLWVEPGEWVDPSRPVGTWVVTDEVWVVGGLSEKSMGRAKLGQKARVRLESRPDQSWDGTLERLGRSLEGRGRLVPLRVRVPNHDGALVPGMWVSAELIERQDPQAILLPLDSIRNSFGGTSVWLLEPQGKELPSAFRARERRIEVSGGSRGMARIASGLAAGDRVVAEGSLGLHDGQLVRILDAESLRGDKSQVTSDKK